MLLKNQELGIATWTSIGQGRENAKIFLKENPSIALSIEDKIRAAHGLDFDLQNDADGEVLEA